MINQILWPVSAPLTFSFLFLPLVAFQMMKIIKAMRISPNGMVNPKISPKSSSSSSSVDGVPSVIVDCVIVKPVLVARVLSPASTS